MPRGAQVIYPKDLAPICMLADIEPGVRVFESGVGSGALSMTMLRWGAEIVGYELREDFANRARTNVRSFLGEDVLARYSVELRDCYDGIDERDVDRVVLDLPEPWRVVPHAMEAMRPGGILVAYNPSITQATQLREAMASKAWNGTRTLEVLHRGWYIEGQAVRPRPPHGRAHGASSPRAASSADPPPTLPITRLTARQFSSGFDEDALAGALLGGLDHAIELVVRNVGHPLGALGVALGGGEDLAVLHDIGETVVEQREDVGRDLLAQAVPRAEILIDPDLHDVAVSSVGGQTQAVYPSPPRNPRSQGSGVVASGTDRCPGNCAPRV
jgi:protein-L-isoaspartate O-methyltransferase